MFKFFKRFLKEEVDPQVLLREKFASFRKLLDANNNALGVMADLEEKLGGDFVFDTGYLNQQVADLGEYISTMVKELNRLSPDRYRELIPLTERLRAEIEQELGKAAAIPETPYILPLQALSRDLAAAVGAKMANLGEIRQHLGLIVPKGFAISAAAYQAFMEHSGLAEAIESRLAAAPLDNLENLEAVSREIQEMVLAAPLPPDLEEILRLTAQSLPSDRLAVRSSAVGEDTAYSFAGQFVTLLNVTLDDLPGDYKKIVASKFTSQAIFYWKHHGFAANQLPMAVGVMVMVPARASGVMFSRDPQNPGADAIIINGVWGLGKYAVDGTINPDHFVASRTGSHEVVEAKISTKAVALACQPEGDCREVALPPEQAAQPCLTPEQIRELADAALKLEKHFGSPQDIEWALDQDGQILILQSRPLRLQASVSPGKEGQPERDREPEAAPLLNFGVRAVGGVAAGPVFILPNEREIDRIPEGAVVVARQPTVRLVMVMNRINAIVTEVGSPTDHMTILAREFKVPTLVEVGGASRVLSPGQMVTVDADYGAIYPGIILTLLNRRQEAAEPWRHNPVFEKLETILKKIAPLHLLDPESPDFQPRNCRTLHDITRFCHEKALDAMFSLDVEEAVSASGVCRLMTDLPLNLFVLDLGGGLAVSGEKQVTEAQVTSRPFLALLRGLHHPQVSWAGQVAPDLKGFISVWANTMYDANKSDRGLGGKSFAIISDNYVNFNSRLGYHFGLVDCYLSEEANDNYISFQFKGGAAAIDRRERRTRLIREILEDLGFKVQIRGDLVQGRMVKFSLWETEQTLESVGLLLAFCRQLDLALSSEAALTRILQAFRNKDYGLACLRPA